MLELTMLDPNVEYGIIAETSDLILAKNRVLGIDIEGNIYLCYEDINTGWVTSFYDPKHIKQGTLNITWVNF